MEAPREADEPEDEEDDPHEHRNDREETDGVWSENPEDGGNEEEHEPGAAEHQTSAPSGLHVKVCRPHATASTAPLKGLCAGRAAVETFTSVPPLGHAVAGKRDLVSILDIERDMMGILELAGNFKNRAKAGETFEPLRGKSLAMIFEKASTRTRVSFEVGMSQLGGHAVNLSPQDTQLGRGETIADTAKVLSRYVDAIMYRAYRHEDMVELARNATVPVINGLDDLEHPCQIISDLFTILECKKKLKGLKIAYVGDGNNVCNSLLLGAVIVGAHVSVGCPPANRPNAGILREAERLAKGTGSEVRIIADPKRAVEGADVVYTDVWVSMGMEKEKQEREKLFRPYQVNSALLKHAKEDAIVMHCLPAHRGLEITDDVIDGPQSVVFDQAENRLHAQKAILARLVGAG